MDILQQCAWNFDRLTNIRYRMIIGRKKRTLELVLTFDGSEFHHLAGLHKLKSNLMVRTVPHLTLFERLLAGRWSLENIAHEDEFPLIRDRIAYLAGLEDFLDSNRLVFRFDYRRAYPSVLKADFLLQNDVEGEGLYLFLAKRRESDAYVCKSFFPKAGKDYAKGQERYTLLYKEKTNLLTGETVVQYDKWIRENAD